MSKLFFDHLINTSQIATRIRNQNLTEIETLELLEIIDELIIHHVLNAVLNHLPKSNHAEFASRLLQNPSDPDLLVYLKSKTNVDIEAEISSHGSKVLAEIDMEIKKSRRRI